MTRPPCFVPTVASTVATTHIGLVSHFTKCLGRQSLLDHLLPEATTNLTLRLGLGFRAQNTTDWSMRVEVDVGDHTHLVDNTHGDLT